MVATPSNAINATSAGLVRFDGTSSFTAVTVTNHDILVGAASNGITSVAPSATSGVPVISQGSSSDPVFGTAVVAGGGTGQVTLTNHGVLVGAGTSAVTQLATGSAGQVLQSGGASADPAYSTATFPSTATSTGTILRADGTNWSATTATYPATTTINQVVYSSANNVVGGITAANNGTMISGTTGVPSWLANGTTGQVLTATTSSPPSWATGTAFTSVVTQVFTSSGTYTPTAGMKYCIVELCGGGGGSGGVSGSGNFVGTGGGGAGGYSRKTITAATIGVSQTVTIGAAGTGGTSVSTTGGTGGTTSLGAIFSATGGVGGLGGTTATGGTYFAGGAGGAGSGGDFNINGAPGLCGLFISSNGLHSGAGGSSFFGGGGGELTVNSGTAGTVATTGTAGTSYGGGAGGAVVWNTTTASGGAGAKGIVIITEFI